jgi:hypothetical protein
MWQELGIAPTADAREIRRAYARRLKTINVDADAPAFQRLRRAFEQALAAAERQIAPPPLPAGPSAAQAPDDSPPPETPPPERAAMPAIALAETPSPAAPRDPAAVDFAADDAALRALRQDFPRALAEGDLDRAFALARTASAEGLLPLEDEHELVAALMDRALVDRRCTGERFMAMVRQFGWTRAVVGDAHGDLREQIAARFEAEAWLANLAAAAARKPWSGYVDRQERALARVALGRARPWRLLVIHTGIIGRLLASYARFEPWIRGRLDAGRLAALREALASTPRHGVAMSVWGLNLVAVGLLTLVLAPYRSLRPVRTRRTPVDRGIPEGWAAVRAILSPRALGGIVGLLLHILFLVVPVGLFLALIALAIVFPPLAAVLIVIGIGRFVKRWK